MGRAPVLPNEYNSRGSAQSAPLPQANVDTSSGLTDVARGLGALGAGLGERSQNLAAEDRFLAAQAEDNARVRVLREMAQARVDANLELERLRNSAGDGGLGITKNFGQWASQYRAVLNQRLPGQIEQRLLEEAWAPFQIDGLELAARSEREEGRAYRIDQLGESQRLALTALTTDPGAFAQVLEEQRAGIAALRDISPDARRDATRDLEGNAAMVTMAALVDRNPAAVLRQLQAEPSGDPNSPITYLDAAQRMRIMDQARAELDRRAARAQAQLATQMTMQQIDLERGMPVDNLISVDRVRAVFGEERARAWELEITASQQYSGLGTATNAQLAEILASPPPAGVDNDTLRMLEAQQTAARRILEQRQDPQRYLIQQGVSQATGLSQSFTTALQSRGAEGEQAWGNFFGLIRERGSAAAVGQSRYGLSDALPLTAEEAAYIGDAVRRLDSAGQEAFFQRAQQALQSRAPRQAGGPLPVYDALVRQVMGGSPETYQAGIIYGSQTETIRQPRETARLILRGRELLSANTPGEGGGGRLLVMPPDADLQAAFLQRAGSAYAGNERASQAAYEVFRAHYAGASEGSRTEAVVGRRADAAFLAATGGVMDWGGGEVLLPFGMSEDTFTDRIAQAWPGVAAEHADILGSASLDMFDLTPTDRPGEYILSIDGQAVPAANGGAIKIRINPNAPR